MNYPISLAMDELIASMPAVRDGEVLSVPELDEENLPRNSLLLSRYASAFDVNGRVI